MSNELVALMSGVTAQRIVTTSIDQVEIMGKDDNGTGFFLTLEPDAQVLLLAMLAEVGLSSVGPDLPGALRMTENDAKEAVRPARDARGEAMKRAKEAREETVKPFGEAYNEALWLARDARGEA